MDQITDKIDEEGNPIKDKDGNPVKKWPEPAKVKIVRGTKEVTVDWEKCVSDAEMRKRF